SQYSRLDQINRQNVHNLKVAWIYHTGDKNVQSQIQCNPLMINGVLYGTSPRLKVFALNAANGKQIWRFDPFPNDPAYNPLGVNRGVSYWSDGNDKRILFVAGSYLYALNAKTGKPIESFGNRRRRSLKDSLDLNRDVSKLFVTSTTPGVVYKNLIIVGTRVSEGSDAAPGHIRAYDVRTGYIKWTFHTIPQPGEFGYNTWPPEAYKSVGAVNNWAGMSLDKKRGIVYIPTGSAAFDFYGGNRKGKDLFANCELALNASTGKLIWYYQMVHHDLWDRDPPSTPNLVTITHNGKRVDAVAQITKQGFVFVFDRDTGKPLFPVEERRVPSSGIPGEQAWSTQPFPMKPKPFATQTFIPTGISPEAHRFAVDSLRHFKTGSLFTPPSLQGTLLFPGYDGGGEWGGAAFDPTTGYLYVNANNIAWLLQLMRVTTENGTPMAAGRSLYLLNCAICHGADLKGDPTSNFPSLVNLSDTLTEQQVRKHIQKGGGFMPSFSPLTSKQQDLIIDYLFKKTSRRTSGKIEVAGKNTLPYAHTGYKKFLDPNGYPANKPPWGTLTAINLNTGNIVWQKPLGEYKALEKKGIPVTGTQNYGGPVVTAGGLIFIAATKDEEFRVFDKKTGDLLWKTSLPAAGYATPSTYMVNGKQYVVIACGGGKLGTKSGDAYVAFSL
ncbi:MAG TPA: PQQ-binding-like beta-propeller repeat protein, partial [Balneolales bacterium]|nr:PQQ-binding-like beta-propeller repeat protein [Balneolales bacterium]